MWGIVATVLGVWCLEGVLAEPGPNVMGGLYWCNALCMCNTKTNVEVQCFQRDQLYQLVGINMRQRRRLENNNWFLEEHLDWCNDRCLCHKHNNNEFRCTEEENLITFISDTIGDSYFYDTDEGTVEQPQHSAAVEEEEQPPQQSSVAVEEEEQPQQSATVEEEEQPQNSAAVEEERQPPQQSAAVEEEEDQQQPNKHEEPEHNKRSERRRNRKNRKQKKRERQEVAAKEVETSEAPVVEPQPQPELEPESEPEAEPEPTLYQETEPTTTTTTTPSVHQEEEEEEAEDVAEVPEDRGEPLPKQEAVAASPAVTALQPPTRRQPFPTTVESFTPRSSPSMVEIISPRVQPVLEVPKEKKTMASKVSQDLNELGSTVLEIKNDVVLNQRILLVTVAIAGIAMLGVLVLAIHGCCSRRQPPLDPSKKRDAAKEDNHVTKLNMEEAW